MFARLNREWLREHLGRSEVLLILSDIENAAPFLITDRAIVGWFTQDRFVRQREQLESMLGKATVLVDQDGIALDGIPVT